MANSRAKGKTLNGFAEINHDAAADIDVGNAQHWVAVRLDGIPYRYECSDVLRQICMRWRIS